MVNHARVLEVKQIFKYTVKILPLLLIILGAGSIVRLWVRVSIFEERHVLVSLWVLVLILYLALIIWVHPEDKRGVRGEGAWGVGTVDRTGHTLSVLNFLLGILNALIFLDRSLHDLRQFILPLGNVRKLFYAVSWQVKLDILLLQFWFSKENFFLLKWRFFFKIYY